MDDIYLGAYWAARQEPIESCAHRLSTFLANLADCSRLFCTWYETGKSRRDALTRRVVYQKKECLVDLLERGRNRGDADGKVIDDLGFDISVWNGASTRQSVGLSITCGLYWQSPHPNVSLTNCVVLDLPDDLGELRSSPRMARLLEVVVSCWEPEWEA